MKQFLTAIVFCLSFFPQPVFSLENGISLFGALKYKKDFRSFDYVDQRAKEGGAITLSALGGFDNLNPFIIKGRPAAQLGLLYDTLMKPSLDEPASSYGLIAKSVQRKKNKIIFNLRSAAKFHDGTPVRAKDVLWSFNTLRAAHPFYQAYWRDVQKVEAPNPLQVVFHLVPSSNRELPFILGQLTVLPKHYWENKKFNATTLEPPLGSGPYRIVKVKAGQSLTFERVKNYWARNLPVNIGQNLIQKIRIEYFGDNSVAFEAFKAGQIDYYLENIAANWALGYGALEKKKGFQRKKVANKNPAGMQGFVFNLRRKKFQDIRVRRAFNDAFDFEWSNRTFFHSAYKRTNSYFEGSPLAAQGVPKGAVRRLLLPYRDKLSKEIWTQPYKNPKTDGTGRNRANLRRAAARLREAGYQIQNNQLVKDGKPLSVSFLLLSPAFEKIVLAYKRQLKKLGIEARVQVVDAAQYRNRLQTYDFDIIVHTFGQSLSPGNEQRDFWNSFSAKQKGGRNVIGIQDPVVDALVEKIITAKTRQELKTATQALDFVLLSGHYVVPQWFLPYHRIAYWKPLTHPPLPPYGLGMPALWSVR